MKFVIDKDIPFIEASVGNHPFPNIEVFYYDALEITNESLKDIDGVIIRTRTRVDKDLLRGTSVCFVATASAGKDHIDSDYCIANKIFYYSCEGGNSQAVCDYVEEAFKTMIDILPYRPSLGLIGVGKIGSLVKQMAKKYFSYIYCYDPPKGIDSELYEIVSKCDVITFHTPLTYADSNPYPTYHMGDDRFLSCCRNGTILINAARGGIIDESALLNAVHQGRVGGYVLDCWENEPNINPLLLNTDCFHLCSYHIAGYSLESKFNIAQMCIDELCAFFKLPPILLDREIMPESVGDTTNGWLLRITQQMEKAKMPNDFEKLRKSYVLR